MEKLIRKKLNNQFIVLFVVLIALAFLAFLLIYSQTLVERDAFEVVPPMSRDTPKEQYEIAKLAAEIKQIRSDTSGSLFWLKMLALFVTVGGAISGYLVGQNLQNKARIDFEIRKNIDLVYQSIVQELSDNNSALLRATAAVKLGQILKSFPHEWDVEDNRREQMIELTKRVLAASLAIDNDPTVLKTITIALVLHHPWKNIDDPTKKSIKEYRNRNLTEIEIEKYGGLRNITIKKYADLREINLEKYGDLREINLSGAKANDAYWAKVVFTNTDFYKADLKEASLRNAVLLFAQFRETILKEAVLAGADCSGANFKQADLRGANLQGTNFSKAEFNKAKFKAAKVYGAILTGAKFVIDTDELVDNSKDADGSQMISLSEWLAKNNVVPQSHLD